MSLTFPIKLFNQILLLQCLGSSPIDSICFRNCCFVPLKLNLADRNLTAVIWTPPLNADVEFVARCHVGSQRHTLVVDVLFISYPNLTECARWDLETQKHFMLYHIELVYLF